ncbi:hypothetical protein C4D60_Mb07t27170 [Musa balbisiana]|uniref:Inositol polyphosphate-related phosphatase domain-containing protein n=1 Tax=Musa balbisiana TaxID=52838 RepID=A0A4S8JIC5_MUSBA|nr:hypothetical protein C4D60_Mb07t27170 [Musa balbisiana]
MRDENSKKSKFSWSKSLVRKWFNIKNKSQDFHADDDVVVGRGDDREWRMGSAESEACMVKKSRTEQMNKKNMDRVRRRRSDVDSAQATDVHDYRIFVSTWNVGGKSPPKNLNLEEWLHASPPADIYVLGFQEIVPLNAGNVLGAEDNGPAKKWLTLIRRTLNTLPGTHGCGSYSTPSPIPDPLVELDADFEVWVRSEIRGDVQNLKVSCVGRGLMGCLGNKGSISISMTLHQTSFCFICSHLTSGQKEGDEARRNLDVMEILKKTRFPRVRKACDEKTHETILDHDRIIWLGDLNYRIALSYQSAKALVEMHNWRALLEKDQLRMEQRCGRVFEGWKEGRICFPPTYKYSNNSDRYTGDDMHRKEKRRTPAWCDRILWYGRGLTQLSYVRGESRFSDHRPVYGTFIAKVEIINHNRIKKNMGCSSSRIEVEELLPYSHGYTQLSFY